jgi:hypothetical protein
MVLQNYEGYPFQSTLIIVMVKKCGRRKYCVKRSHFGTRKKIHTKILAVLILALAGVLPGRGLIYASF